MIHWINCLDRCVVVICNIIYFISYIYNIQVHINIIITIPYDQMAQGYRGININTRDDEESVGEMHMKDYIDVSNQENVAPVYFQSLSLD